jgi:hypothetical protein
LPKLKRGRTILLDRPKIAPFPWRSEPIGAWAHVVAAGNGRKHWNERGILPSLPAFHLFLPFQIFCLLFPVCKALIERQT